MAEEMTAVGSPRRVATRASSARKQSSNGGMQPAADAAAAAAGRQSAAQGKQQVVDLTDVMPPPPSVTPRVPRRSSYGGDWGVGNSSKSQNPGASPFPQKNGAADMDMATPAKRKLPIEQDLAAVDDRSAEPKLGSCQCTCKCYAWHGKYAACSAWNIQTAFIPRDELVDLQVKFNDTVSGFAYAAAGSIAKRRSTEGYQLFQIAAARVGPDGQTCIATPMGSWVPITETSAQAVSAEEMAILRHDIADGRHPLLKLKTMTDSRAARTRLKDEKLHKEKLRKLLASANKQEQFGNDKKAQELLHEYRVITERGLFERVSPELQALEDMPPPQATPDVFGARDIPGPAVGNLIGGDTSDRMGQPSRSAARTGGGWGANKPATAWGAKPASNANTTGNAEVPATKSGWGTTNDAGSAELPAAKSGWGTANNGSGWGGAGSSVKGSGWGAQQKGSAEMPATKSGWGTTNNGGWGGAGSAVKDSTRSTQQIGTWGASNNGNEKGGSESLCQTGANTTPLGQRRPSGGDAGPSTCYKCNQEGHTSKDCPSSASGGSGTCFKCNEPGHTSRECTHADVVCRRCKQEGHKGNECPNQTGPTCFNCQETGHVSKDCTQPTPGRPCYNCQETGHVSKDCSQPMRGTTCYNCQGSGHMSKDCTQPRAGPTCFNCQETGHMSKDCTQPRRKRQNTDASSSWDINPTNNGDACNNFLPVWGQATNGRNSGTTGWGGGQWSKAQPVEGAREAPTKSWGSFNQNANAGETAEPAPTAGTSNGWARPKWGQSKASTETAGQIGSDWGGAIGKGDAQSYEDNDGSGNSGTKQELSAPAQPGERAREGPTKGWGSLNEHANAGQIGEPAATAGTSNGWARPKWGQGKPSKDAAGHNGGWDAIGKGDAQFNKENSGSGNSNREEPSGPGSESTEVVSITQTEVCDTGCNSNGNSSPKPNASDCGWGAGGEDDPPVPADDTGGAGADLAQPEQDNDALDTPQQDQRDAHSAGCKQNANGWSKPAAIGWSAGKSNGWGNKASRGWK